MSSAQSRRSEPRQMYAFEAHTSLHPRNRQRVCDAILGALGARMTFAVIDAYSDYEGDLTPAARDAQAELRAAGATRRRGDTNMGIELDLRDARQRTRLEVYGPWSINADLWGGRYWEDLGCFHDSSYSLVAALTAAEVAALDASLSDLGHFESVAKLDAERRSKRLPNRLGRHLTDWLGPMLRR